MATEKTMPFVAAEADKLVYRDAKLAAELTEFIRCKFEKKRRLNVKALIRRAKIANKDAAKFEKDLETIDEWVEDVISSLKKVGAYVSGSCVAFCIAKMKNGSAASHVYDVPKDKKAEVLKSFCRLLSELTLALIEKTKYCDDQAFRKFVIIDADEAKTHPENKIQSGKHYVCNIFKYGQTQMVHTLIEQFAALRVDVLFYDPNWVSSYALDLELKKLGKNELARRQRNTRTQKELSDPAGEKQT